MILLDQQQTSAWEMVAPRLLWVTSRSNSALWRHLRCKDRSIKVALTLEAVDIVASLTLREARLVAMAIDGSDPGFTPTTALSRGDNGVAHASIRQPARTAEVQTIIPSGVQLSCSGHFCTATPTEGLGLREGETLGGGAVEHLTCTQRDGCHVIEGLLLVFLK